MGRGTPWRRGGRSAPSGRPPCLPVVPPRRRTRTLAVDWPRRLRHERARKPGAADKARDDGQQKEGETNRERALIGDDVVQQAAQSVVMRPVSGMKFM